MFLFQETVITAQDAEAVEKAINFGAIGFNILIITITVGLLLLAYALRSYQTDISALDWIKTNKFRWAIGFLMIVGVSILLVLTPDINIMLAALGFNPDKSPVAIGIAITLLLIGATSQPTKVPKGEL